MVIVNPVKPAALDDRGQLGFSSFFFSGPSFGRGFIFGLTSGGGSSFSAQKRLSVSPVSGSTLRMTLRGTGLF